MSTAPTVRNTLQAEKSPKVCRWQFAQTHPVLAFLLITFAWTWLFRMYRKLPSLTRASNVA